MHARACGLFLSRRGLLDSQGNIRQFQEPGAFTFTADTTNSAIASFELGYLRTLTQCSGQFFNNRNPIGHRFGFPDPGRP